MIDESSKDSEKARLHAVSAPKSGLFLKTIPILPTLALDDNSFQMAVRLRLGAPPPDLPTYCPLCRSNTDLDIDPWHALSCTSQRRKIIKRHNSVAREIYKWIHHLGGQAKLEPLDLEDGSNRRPDLEIIMGGKTFLVDVSIRNPTCPSNSALGAKGKLKVAATAEKEKSKKYEAMALEQGAEFVPFILETHGGFGDRASAFIDLLVKESAALSHAWAPHEVVYGLHHSIAVALHRGSADALTAVRSSGGKRGWSYPAERRRVVKRTRTSIHVSFPGA